MLLLVLHFFYDINKTIRHFVKTIRHNVKMLNVFRGVRLAPFRHWKLRKKLNNVTIQDLNEYIIKRHRRQFNVFSD